jgi:AcrR family transcriptional regulator
MTELPITDAPRRGARSEEVLLTATLDLLADIGYAELTIEGVAQRTGVAKSTIYRWWPSKAALVIAAIAPMMDAVNPVASAASDSLRADVEAAVRRVSDLFKAQLDGRAIAGLIADMARDPEMAEEYRRRILRPRRAAVAAVFGEWQRRGALQPDVDVELLQDLYVGPIYYRSLVTGAAVDDELVTQLVDAVLAAGATNPEEHR